MDPGEVNVMFSTNIIQLVHTVSAHALAKKHKLFHNLILVGFSHPIFLLLDLITDIIH